MWDILVLFVFKTHSLDMYAAHSEYTSQSGILPKFATVYSLLLVYSLWSALCVAMVVVHKPTSQQFAKEKPTFLFGRRNTATFKHYEKTWI